MGETTRKIQSLSDIDPELFPKEIYGDKVNDTPNAAPKGKITDLSQINIPASDTSAPATTTNPKDAINQSVESMAGGIGGMTGALMGARQLLKESKLPTTETSGPGYPAPPVPLSPPVTPEELTAKYTTFQDTKAELDRLQKLAAERGMTINSDAVTNWKNQVEQGMTDIEARQAGRYGAVSKQAEKVAAMDPELFKGYQAGQNFLLPTPMASQENMLLNDLERAVKAHHLASKDYTTSAANWKKMTEALPKSLVQQGAELLGQGVKYISPFLKPIGGYLGAKDIVHAINEGRKGNYPEAAISGAEGLGGLMMMSGNAPVAIVGGALQTPRLLKNYAQTISPLLKEDPRNAQFLIP